MIRDRLMNGRLAPELSRRGFSQLPASPAILTLAAGAAMHFSAMPSLMAIPPLLITRASPLCRFCRRAFISAHHASRFATWQARPSFRAGASLTSARDFQICGRIDAERILRTTLPRCRRDYQSPPLLSCQAQIYTRLLSRRIRGI